MTDTAAPEPPDACHRLNYETYVEAVGAETRRLAGMVEGADLTVTVPTCPEWNLEELLRHLAEAHRWFATLVEQRSTRMLEVEVPAPESGAAYPAWLVEGAEMMESAFRGADPETPVWSWSGDDHAWFWPRRALHETAVHRVDAELALGKRTLSEYWYGADAIDEFFGIIPAVQEHNGVAAGQERPGVLALSATDSDVHWHIALGPDGFTTRHAAVDEPADSVLAGPAGELALVLNRRLSLENGHSRVLTGDRQPWERWLDTLVF